MQKYLHKGRRPNSESGLDSSQVSLGGLHGLQVVKTMWTGLQAGGGTGGVVDWSPDG
jgi:hypothetical protein